jgi:hypothetical protein
MAAVAHQARTSSAVQHTAAELLPTTPELGRGMAEHLVAAIAEIAAIDDDDLLAELLASTEANVGQVLRMLAHGPSADDVTAPHEALNYLRGNVRRGIPLSVLLRSYRLGHAWLWERWSQALKERVIDSGELAAGQDESSAFMFASSTRSLMPSSRSSAASGSDCCEARRRSGRRLSAGSWPLSPSTRNWRPAGWVTSCVATMWRCGYRAVQARWMDSSGRSAKPRRRSTPVSRS